MGGKKHGQRTKGNTRPSSSGRSAERLSNSGAPVAEIFGFGLLHGNLSAAKASGIDELADFEIDGDCRMILKKMTKKDQTTRLKAVQEFKTFCVNRSTEDLNKILPIWPRLYNKLSVDHDRRVREATHEAHGELVSRVKKNLAPHLKLIMGNWLLAQCDPYSPSASAAKSSFESAFAAAKQQEALAYCAREILTFIRDNMCKQTALTLSDAELTSQEEMEEKYNRIVASSMDALGLFVSVCAAEQDKWLEVYEEIVSDAKFWKYAKSQSTLVKAAWYRLVCSFCKTVPSLLSDKFAAKFCPLTLGCLDESDPVVAPLVWEAALFTVSTVENCWENVNVAKAMLPSLWVTLREGGHGNASAIYPNLLPLLNSIPKSSLLNLPKFFTDFFNNCRQGMLQPAVKMSSSEQIAIVTAFMECLKYALLDIINSQSNLEFLDYLITEQLLVVIESSLVEWKSLPVAMTLYRHLYETLLHWRNQELIEAAYKGIAATFWSSFSTLCCGVTLDTVEESGHDVLANLAALFSCLKGSDITVKRKAKSSRVRFSEVEFEKLTLTEKHENVIDPKLSKNTADVALNVCEISLRRVSEENCVHHMIFLPKMMAMFGSAQLFSHLLKSSKQNEVEDVDLAPIRFFKEVLLEWIDEDFDGKCVNRQKMDCISNMSLAVYSCICTEDKLHILTEICTLKNIWFLEDTITKLFTSNPDDPVLHRWFKSSQLGLLAVELAVQMSDVSQPIVITEQWSSSLRLLSLCFKTNSRSEPLLDMEIVGKIFHVLYTSLSSWNDENPSSKDCLNRSVDFVCQLASSFFNNVKDCWKVPESEELLLTLFVQTFERNVFTSDALQKLTASWMSSVSSLVRERGAIVNCDGFLYKAATAVNNFLMNDSLNNLNIQKVSEASVELLRIIYDSLPSCSSTDKTTMLSDATVRELLSLMFPGESDWKDMSDNLDNQWMCGQLLDGLVLHETSTLLLSTESPKSSVQHVCFAHFATQVIQSIVNAAEEDCNSQQPDTQFIVDETQCQFLFPHLLEIYYTRKYCRAIQEIEAEYVAAETRLLVDGCFEIVDGFCRKILTKLSSADVSNLLSKAITRSFDCGYLWSLVVEDLVNEIMKDGDVNMNQLMMSKPIDSVEAVHTMQAFAKILDLELLERLLGDAVNSIGATDTVDFTNCVVPLALTIACLQRLPLSEETCKVTLSLLDILHEWKTQYPSVLLQSWENELSADTVSFNVQVMKILNLSVVKFHKNLLAIHRDFILCSLASWIKICCENITSWKSQAELFDIVSVACDLLNSVSHHMDICSKLGEASDMISEWAEFFAEQVFNPLLPLFVKLAGSLDVTNVNLAQDLILQNIANGLQWILEAQVVNHKLALKFSPDTDDEEPNLPDAYKVLINHLQPLLLCKVKAVQICSFKIISKVVWKFPNFGADREESADDQEDTRPITASLRTGLVTTSGVIEDLLSRFKIGDCCVVQPYTDSYTYTQSYLLWWHLILDYFQAASSQHRSQYAAYLREFGLATSLCENLFKLMPANVTISKAGSLSTSKELGASPKKTISTPTLFSEPPKMHPKVRSSSEDVGHLACAIYYKTVKYMPALVREWWKSLDKRSSIIVEKFTAKHVSVLLCLQEMKSVQQSDKRFKNMQVKARPTTREVIATYTIDDISIELVITLAENHPLGPVSVETGKRIGVSSTQWSYWMLQLITFLSHQNGSVLDGLALWKKNIDKKFEGVTECHICFYILHATTSQLPRLQCRTCKKKFHSACLYKWFSTSNNATCPLCRTVF